MKYPDIDIQIKYSNKLVNADEPQVSLEIKSPLEAFQLLYCSGNDTKSTVIFLHNFFVICTTSGEAPQTSTMALTNLTTVEAW